MIHPDTEVRFIDPAMGRGVFATADIPCGTIVYVKDRLEIELTDEAFHALDEPLRAQAEKYAYTDERGVRILSWDNAKYVNHRCDCNTISTGYGFEIAIRDIACGEEICDDYGLFNVEEDIPVSCNCPCCRGTIRPDDIETHHEEWDRMIIPALARVPEVEQPLMAYMEDNDKRKLRAYLCAEAPYTSVTALRYKSACKEADLPPGPIGAVYQEANG
ncbi:SET domain-containing protein-lysine N-methyltransferase [Pseudodesulfovibrio cashew]|uniref:SET domain-containing protein-lysine N-methyltransferase n=1 Tax=Pseudodesulfovibrio cashew TaxID=2678688 RepID=A0A6I6JEV9_9BACT|nr:SET domain-containing protein [Pseudodesulfovibrio cashew]QGY39548.1 SET domain-containing protein-lysine N-methyltransferase [Pseudodesulfovibrio cashew]